MKSHTGGHGIYRICKESYWTGEKMLKHTKEIVIPFFNYAFPDFELLLAFDNLLNHSSFAPDALLASTMNLNPGRKNNHECMMDGITKNIYHDP